MNDAATEIVTAPAGPEHEEGLLALFRAASSPCYCRFWHFEGTNNEWLERCASAPAENASAFQTALAAQISRKPSARPCYAVSHRASRVSPRER
jgi:hypothetical protein